MTSAADFTSLLNTPVDSIERPKPLPAGTYTFIIKRHEFDESSKKKTKFVRYWCAPVAPGPDVDTALLPEGWAQKEMKLDFYLTADAMFRIKDFFSHLGLNASGRTLGAVIPEATNGTFTGTVTHETAQNDPEQVYANIASTAKA